jgi:hypothetical protein
MKPTTNMQITATERELVRQHHENIREGNMILGRVQQVVEDQPWWCVHDPMTDAERAVFVQKLMSASGQDEDWEACEVCGLDSRHEDCTEVEVLR